MQKVDRKELKSNVTVTDSFWRKRMEIVRDEVIPYQWEALNDNIPGAAPSHAIENFRIAAGEQSGEFGGMVFQDSDLMKWLEAVAFSVENDPDPELEKKADEVIGLIGNAQQQDGYIDTYFIIKEPEKRWTNLRDWHELYCAGHMIEAAVAYFNSTGKSAFLDIVCRYADYIDSVFGKEPEKLQGYPGHQEIELALVKLYQVTGNERYLKLSQFFIDERGKQPHYFDREKHMRGDQAPFWWHDDYGYLQAHVPVREQKQAVGHSVRAMYMYSAMADLALLTNDKTLKNACESLWENVTERQMYITGGIGSQQFGEAFSFEYDLPNNLCYTETCASIGLVFWAKRMLNLKADGRYADIMEKALYNGTISGMDLDGKKFFYVNPLEVHPETSQKRKDHAHVKPVRQSWYACACCPPNLARLIASIGHYIYSSNNNQAFVHLFVGSETSMELNGQTVKVSQQTNYPWNGNVQINVSPETPVTFSLAIRIPGWCRNATLQVNDETILYDDLVKDGYVYLEREWKEGDKVELHLSMPVEKMRSHPKVRENAGKIALQRGPIVYCLEEADNGADLQEIQISKDNEWKVEYSEDLDGIVSLFSKGYRMNEALWGESLYSSQDLTYREVEVKAIPYYAWCNRVPGEMRVWIQER